MIEHSCTIALTYEQREQVARDFLLELLYDLEIPFQDAEHIVCIKRLIAYLSTPGDFLNGEFDES